MAQGGKTLVAATVVLLALLTGTAVAQQPIEGLGAQTRLTAMGPDGNASFTANSPAVAYNPDRDEFFVVFAGRTPDFPVEQEIYGLVLDGAGRLRSGPVRLTGVSGDATVSSATNPDVVYAGTGPTKRYVVSYAAGVSTAPAQTEIFGVTVDASGSTPSAPVQVSTHTNPATSKFQPSLAYDSTRNEVRFVWIGTTASDPEFEVRSERRSADLTASGGEITVSEMGGALGSANNAAAIFLPAPISQYLFVWEGDLNASDGQFEIFAERQQFGSVETVAQRALTVTPGADADALAPSVAYDPARQRIMIAYVKSDPALDGSEIFVRRFNAGLDPFAAEQRASTMGPTGATNFAANEPSLTFLPGPDRYLVTWRGDNNFPGLVDNEVERWGQAFSADGVELATDDFRISTAGPDGNPLNTVGPGAVEAAHPPSRHWLAVYSADDSRPPLADNEFELYDRPIGENFDRDRDGSLVPADCNDGNAGIRPGAADVPDNGVDEDCSGADTINLDRDGDGSQRPADCNDGNPAIAPGKRDIPNNDIDEDCSKGARRVLTSAGIERFFQVFRNFTKVTKLRVTKVKPGMKIRLRCTPKKGKGCPKKLRGNGRTFTIKKSGSKTLTSFVKKAKLKPGATLEVRILEPGAIGRLDRFEMRKAKLPKRIQRCIPFGKKKAQKSC